MGPKDKSKPPPNPFGSDRDRSKKYGCLAQLDSPSSGTSHTQKVDKPGGTRQPKLSSEDPPCLDMFIPHGATAESCAEAVKDYYSGGFNRYVNMRGLGSVDDDFFGTLGKYRNETRAVVIEKLPDEGEVDGKFMEEESTIGQVRSTEEMETGVGIVARSTRVSRRLSPRGRSRQAGVKRQPIYIPPTDCPPLTQEMIRANDNALVGDENDVIRELGPHRLYRRDMAKLKPGVWLEDQIIGFYLELIKTRNRERGLRSIYTLPSTFYALLGSAQGLEKVRDAADNDNIFNFDLLLIPVCKYDHWRLVVVYIAERKIRSFNSMSSADLLIRKNILKFVQSEEKRLGRAPVEWEQIDESVPQQTNVDDCGVFVIQFANYVALNRRIDFSQRNMDYFRQLALYECVQGRLLL